MAVVVFSRYGVFRYSLQVWTINRERLLIMYNDLFFIHYLCLKHLIRKYYFVFMVHAKL